nr:TniQ family protein [Enterovibrio paralichthyis]
MQRPSPHSDESLENFFIRVANRNGYEKVDRFLLATKRYLLSVDQRRYQTFPTDICRINPCSSQQNSSSRTSALHQLSQMTFNEKTEILQLPINRTSMKFSPSTNGLVRGSEVIPRSLLRITPIPACPCCLSEFGYANYLWHFSGYQVCHKHKIALQNHCDSCGTKYDYRLSGLSGTCGECGEPITAPQEVCEHSLSVSEWLAGQTSTPLPDLPKSYRWGLVHWWTQISNVPFNAETFVQFWNDWPDAWHKRVQEEIEFRLEHATVDLPELRLKDVLGNLFFSSICLPERNLKFNWALRDLLQFIEEHLWDKGGSIANLRMNAFEVAVFLNCSLDQVASLVAQRQLKPNKRTKPNVPMSNSDYLFYLGDVYCLWLSEFQTDAFSRSFYTSRW